MTDIGISDWRDVKYTAYLPETSTYPKIRSSIIPGKEVRCVNRSGIQPIEYKVLVLPDTLSDATAGGIIRPDRVKEIEQAAAVRGYLVAFGGKAFEDFGDPVPKIGDRIQYAKYSGVHQVPGADGKQYILCNDKDIAAIIIQEELIIKEAQTWGSEGNWLKTEEKYRFNPEIANYEREE